MSKIDMFGFLKNHTYPIGVDMGDDALRAVQLGGRGKGSDLLIAGDNENRPADVKVGSGDWQRWAVKSIRRMAANDRFHGRTVVAELPASEVFIDHIKMPKVEDGVKPADVIFSKVKKKLLFEPDGAVMKYIAAEEDNVVVIVNQREKIDRHLAIYEQAGMRIKSIGVWPVALINSYVRFFGRRRTDVEAVVMLLDIETGCTNVVICRHRNLLFARSIPIWAGQLCGAGGYDTECSPNEMVTKLTLELTACMRHFSSMYKKARIERLIFLSGRAVDREVCTTIAGQLELPAQVGDCLAAVEIPVGRDGLRIDRRELRVNWAAAFGLSLWDNGQVGKWLI